jgi:hypothetical protein
MYTKQQRSGASGILQQIGQAIEASNALFNEEVNANTGQTVTQDETMRLFPEIEDTGTSNKNLPQCEEEKEERLKGNDPKNQMNPMV